jgi:hypothetical protein
MTGQSMHPQRIHRHHLGCQKRYVVPKRVKKRPTDSNLNFTVYRDLSALDFAVRNCGSADEYSTDDVRLTSWNILPGHAGHKDEGFGFVASAETLALLDTINAKRRPTTHRRVEIAVRLRVHSYFPPFSLAHRASTAFLAISVRCAGESFAARALPPRDCKARS